MFGFHCFRVAFIEGNYRLGFLGRLLTGFSILVGDFLIGCCSKGAVIKESPGLELASILTI